MNFDDLAEYAARLIGGALGGLIDAFRQAAGNVRWPTVRKTRPVRRVWRRLACKLFAHAGPLDVATGVVTCQRCGTRIKGPRWTEVGR